MERLEKEGTPWNSEQREVGEESSGKTFEEACGQGYLLRYRPDLIFHRISVVLVMEKG